METKTWFGLSMGDRRALRLNMHTYFDLQAVRMETDNRIRAYADYEGLVKCVGEERAEEISLSGPDHFAAEVNKMKDDPRFIEAKEKAEAWLENDENHKDIGKLALEQENILRKKAKEKIEAHPVYQQWLSRVKGIGPCLAGGLLATGDPTKANSMSAMWKYFGLDVQSLGLLCTGCKRQWNPDEPAPGSACPDCKAPLFRMGQSTRPTKGEKLGYSPNAKVLAFKIGSQFVRTVGSQYRKLYDQFRAKVNAGTCHKIHIDAKTKKEYPCPDAHKFAKARRMVAKIFIGHYWIVSRALLGLPVPKPFAFGVLGHDSAHYIEPMVDEGDPLPARLTKPWEVPPQKM